MQLNYETNIKSKIYSIMNCNYHEILNYSYGNYTIRSWWDPEVFSEGEENKCGSGTLCVHDSVSNI